MVAISNSASGLVVRVITDHQGAPITDIHIAIKPAKVSEFRPTITTRILLLIKAFLVSTVVRL